MMPSVPDGHSLPGAPPTAGQGGRLRAGAASILLHVVVILATGWLPWSPPEYAAPEVLSLTLLRPPARPAGAELLRELSRPDSLRIPETVPIETPEPERPENIPEPAPPEPPTPVEPEARGPAEPEAEAPLEPAEAPAERVPSDVEWEAERRRAVRETLERQRRYRPLGPEEETPGSFERPWDDIDVFEGAAGPSGPRVLEPGKAGSRFGNRLAELCNTLTGGGLGVGLNSVGMFALCVESDARSELFATIKPEYLKSRPVCTEVEQRASLDGTIQKTHDCRLVPKSDAGQ